MSAKAESLSTGRSRIIVALDVATPTAALALVRRLRGRAGLFKVGSQLFTAAGPGIIRALVARGQRVFLDLKFHDIPHIVAEACSSAADLRVSLLTVHSSGGPKMLAAARAALEKYGRNRPRLLAVTLLTSFDERELHRAGFPGSVERNVIRLARLAKESGADGVICAPTDSAAVRRACGPKFLIVTPGIRAGGGKKAADQARVATAAEAIRAGADYVVIGRAVTQAPDPQRAFDDLALSIAALRH